MLITLKEYLDQKGYKKNSKGLSFGLFADTCGVSLAYISKLYNARYIGSSKTKTFMKVASVVAKDGYTLIKSDPISFADDKIRRQNKRLQLELNYYESKCKELQEKLDDLEKIVKLCEKIAKERGGKQ